MAKESQGNHLLLATVTVNATPAANVAGERRGFRPSMSAGVIDVTNLQSTAKEKMIGLRRRTDQPECRTGSPQ